MSSNQSWCTVSSSSGNGDNTVSFTVTENTTEEERTAVLIVQAGELSQKITVVQQSKSAMLSVSTNSFSVNADANTYSFTITSNMDWTVSSDQSWCSLFVTNGTGNQEVSFQVSENISVYDRSATIVVRAGSLTLQIVVTQEGDDAIFEVSQSQFDFGPERGETVFSLITNLKGRIDFDYSDSWFRVIDAGSSVINGYTQYLQRLFLDENISTKSRTGTLTLRHEGSGQSIKITIFQEGCSFLGLTVSPKNLSITAEGGTVNFSVTINYSWTIQSNSEWCIPQRNVGSGNEVVFCTIEPNSQSVSRTAIITVSGAGLSEQVIVTQEAAEKVVEIVNIPDANFKAYLVENFDTDGDGEISKEEAKNVTSIWCDNMGIYSLQGIEYFTSVLKIYCPNNKLTSLDVSKNTTLLSLVCDANELETLTIGNNSKFRELWCAKNKLKNIDITGCPNLDFIYCYANQLNSLDVSKNTIITNISCWSNQIQSLDISKNRRLTILQCGWNKISTLDLSYNTELETLSCEYNSLSVLDISNNTKINSLQCFGMDELLLYIKSGQEFSTYSVGDATVVYK